MATSEDELRLQQVLEQMPVERMAKEPDELVPLNDREWDNLDQSSREIYARCMNDVDKARTELEQANQKASLNQERTPQSLRQTGLQTSADVQQWLKSIEGEKFKTVTRIAENIKFAHAQQRQMSYLQQQRRKRLIRNLIILYFVGRAARASAKANLANAKTQDRIAKLQEKLAENNQAIGGLTEKLDALDGLTDDLSLEREEIQSLLDKAQGELEALERQQDKVKAEFAKPEVVTSQKETANILALSQLKAEELDEALKAQGLDPEQIISGADRDILDKLSPTIDNRAELALAIKDETHQAVIREDLDGLRGEIAELTRELADNQYEGDELLERQDHLFVKALRKEEDLDRLMMLNEALLVEIGDVLDNDLDEAELEVQHSRLQERGFIGKDEHLDKGGMMAFCRHCDLFDEHDNLLKPHEYDKAHSMIKTHPKRESLVVENGVAYLVPKSELDNFKSATAEDKQGYKNAADERRNQVGSKAFERRIERKRDQVEALQHRMLENEQKLQAVDAQRTALLTELSQKLEERQALTQQLSALNQTAPEVAAQRDVSPRPIPTPNANGKQFLADADEILNDPSLDNKAKVTQVLAMMPAEGKKKLDERNPEWRQSLLEVQGRDPDAFRQEFSEMLRQNGNYFNMYEAQGQAFRPADAPTGLAQDQKLSDDPGTTYKTPTPFNTAYKPPGSPD